MSKAAPVGSTVDFVLGQGFCPAGPASALIASDNGLRLFAELTADPDRPEVRPLEAYQALLTSMQPGWTVRLLRIFWPDPAPRQAFLESTQAWKDGQANGILLLRDGLRLFLQEAPLPFMRRTILEFTLPGSEGLSWWQGVTGLLAGYGVRMRPLSQEEITSIAHWILNPHLE